MKRILSHLLSAALLLFPITLWAQQTTTQSKTPATTTAAATPATGPEKYTLDPNHTYVLWFVNHMGFSTQVGKFPASGSLVVDEKNPQNSNVNVSIDVSKPITGVPKLNEHLMSKDFFDVAKFPTATFVSDKVDLVNGKSGKVSGTLTLHGISKPVVLDVHITGIGVSPITQKKTIGFSATTYVKRSDYGISAYLPGLRNDVRLIIGGEANLAQ